MKFKIVNVLFLLAGLCLNQSLAKGPAFTDPGKADGEFAFQGEFSGMLNAGGAEVKVGIQVVALGNARFRAISYVGGLPGDGYFGELRVQSEAELKDGKVMFESERGKAELTPEKMEITALEGTVTGTLKRVQRESPTLGMAPPSDAVVLYGGPSDVEKWQNGRASDDGLLMQGVTSKEKFGDHHLHIEFRLPYQPEDRGQGRGNSGIYLQGRNEVQMLDSFGLEGKDNECGGLYEVKAPDVNMCLPPLSWQTYDIDFTAARYNDAGEVTSAPRITVRHNGVLIHKDVELPKNRSSRAAPVRPGPEPGPVYLQDHGNPVRYRNIWAQRR